MSILDDLLISNAACAQIGAEPLESMDDETLGGQSARLIYGNLLDFCLDLAPWSFATYAVQLSAIDDATSAFGHSHVYQLPGGRVGPPSQLISDITNPLSTVTLFALERDRLHASVSPLYAVIKFRAEPTAWSGSFKLAFTTALAGKFAVPMCHDLKLEAAKTDEAFGSPSQFPRGGMMGTALQVDSRAKPARQLPAATNPLLQAHMGGGGNGWRGSGTW